MNLTEKEVKAFFHQSSYHRGKEYLKNNAILPDRNGNYYRIEEDEYGDEILITAVLGTEVYMVAMPLEEGFCTEDSLEEATCTCPHFHKNGWECKHIVAAVLSYLSRDQEGKLNSSYSTRRLIELYTQKQLVEEGEGDVLLVPKFQDLRGEYPSIRFYVGKERLYTVKKVDEFLDFFDHQTKHYYGKELTLVHELSQFEECSSQLIQLLSSLNNQREHHYSYQVSHLSRDKRCVQMDGNTFGLFFQLYLGKTVEVEGKNPLFFLEGNPKLSVELVKEGHGATLRFLEGKSLFFFGNESQLYVMSDREFFCCSKVFSQKIHPLTRYMREDMYISQEDLPSICGSFLTAIEDVVEIVDEEAICQAFLPDECIPTFYFDRNKKEEVIGKLVFFYDEIEIPLFAPEDKRKNIRSNLPMEQKAITFFFEYFTYSQNKKTILLNCEEELFFTELLEKFRKIGDVFLEKSLKNIFVPKEVKPTVGISVAEGLISLDLDTGEFPLSELEGLYHSYLKKKTYHKLQDGRYYFLDGSGYEKVAEISHMLQLSPKELEENQVTLPAYRALYLDSVLDSYEMVETKRNLNFRRMMKDFKSISDSDFQPSEALQTTLRPYQILGFQWLKTLEQHGFGGILADEMGLGKTVQVITFLLSLEEQEKPSLVVCPASLLLNWGDELEKFAPSLEKLLILGNAKERKEQITGESTAKVWVTSYDLLKRDREHYEGKGFYSLFLDEAQNVKNQSTLVSKTVKTISCDCRFVLTGTPIENRLSELWNLFDFLMPGYLFKHNAFVSKLEKPIVQSGDSTAGRQLSLLVQPFIMRRLKKDVLKELPDKIEHIRKIHLSEEERKVYLAATASVKAEAEKSKSKLQILALLTQLRQLCCDPNLCFENYGGESSKLEACLELCQSMVENGHKILLFSQFTTMLDILRGRLNELEIKNLTIEGSTSKEKRAKYVKEFQNGQADIFLISLKAGGTGLNLTHADVVIHYDPWWNQAAQNQATDRAHRIGQQQHVQVYKLIAQGTIEEKILELQEKKAGLMEQVMEETGDSTLSYEDIMDLLE